MKRGVAACIPVIPAREPGDHFPQPVGCGIVDGLVAGGIGDLRIGSLIHQEKGGICTLVVKQAYQRGTSFIVRHVDVGPLLEQLPEDFLVTAPCRRVERAFGTVVDT